MIYKMLRRITRCKLKHGVISVQSGFTLIELMVVMGITMFVLYAGSQIMTALIYQFKQQSKIAETQIESTIALDVMRSDIVKAGTGLANRLVDTSGNENDNWGLLAPYVELADGAAQALNDNAPNAAAAPKAVVGYDPAFDTFNNSDYLVVKATNVGSTQTSSKWHLFYENETGTDQDKTWEANAPPTTLNLNANDKVVVIRAMADSTGDYNLALSYNGAEYRTTYTNVTADFQPMNEGDRRLAFGVLPSTDPAQLRVPFNRVDYFISTDDNTVPRPALPGGMAHTSVPSRCANGTGVLVRAVMNHANGMFESLQPIMDCVADMQVVFWDKDRNPYNDIIGLTADQIRDIREVQVYILSHEGQIDPRFTYTGASLIRIGDAATGRDFDVSGIETRWQNYRWKVYRLSAKPLNLRG